MPTVVMVFILIVLAICVAAAWVMVKAVNFIWRMETTGLLTLKEHNELMASVYPPAKGDGNGIECPKCKEELRDTHPERVLASYPPQKDIHCPKCGWKGYRVA